MNTKRILKGSQTNTKTMAAKTVNQSRRRRGLKRAGAFVALTVLVVAGLGQPAIRADQYDQQIQQLQNQNASAQDTLNGLAAQASSYQDAINKLQQQIGAMQAAIAANQAKQAQLQQQIAQDQAQIAHEKVVLGEDLKTMYVDGQMSTIEELATSNNLSDYIDKEEYRQAVQAKIQSTLKDLANLQQQLQQQQSQLTIVLNLQRQQNAQLAAAQAQQQQMLAYNQSQQSAYNSQIAANQSQIAVLRAEQIAANRRLVNSGGGRVLTTGSCGGSYPAQAQGPYGSWGCDYSLDNTIDNWGMYNRECVSYTAWMVYKTYGYMPYWGGSGDAREWPGDAQAAGIPTGTVPKPGAVAIYMGGAGDPWGHAMWVKSVNGDMITVDQYNLYYDGNFYETTIPASGLVYIYFGG